jgi:membrane-associated phospholipid phosphatase
LEYLTDFADEAVMLPLVATVAIALALSGWWRGFAAWVVVVPGVLGMMGFLKYLFFTCAIPLDITGIHSPSGHTAVSAAIYGGLLVLLLRGRLPNALVFAIPPVLALVFGFSRVVLHAHVPIEAVVGGIVGLAGAAILVWCAGKRPPFRIWPIALGAAVVVFALHGYRFRAENMIHHLWVYTWIPLPAVCRA